MRIADSAGQWSMVRIRVVLCTMVLFVPLAVYAGQSSPAASTEPLHPARETVARLAKAEIDRVDIFYVPWQIDTTVAITPDMLERGFYCRLTIRYMLYGARGRKVVEALNSLTVEPHSESDLRWGIVFYDRKNVRLGAVYFDARGRHGAVDGHPVAIRGSLFRWLSKSVSACVR